MMEKKEYINKQNAIIIVWDCFQPYDYENSGVEERLKSIPPADVVPWSWLQSYANDKRCNYASDFVVEAKEVWENGTADKTCE